ncbi:MAG: peptide chain release factor N(5)-glutamine methyltransferase [Muribaculum sp.]|nr:peptide chain release factor N(5)-glutamine methyltransferase [Muribaculum sp.]
MTNHTAANANQTQRPLVHDVVLRLREELTPIYGQGESDAMIRLIFEHLKNWGPVDIIIHERQPVSEFIEGEIDKILERLRRHEPIQYILGMTYFYGMNFRVGPGVLIPRPETEELIDIIVNSNKEKDLKVLDIATGSGCIAIALSRNLLFPQVEAFDISPKALEVARRNAEVLKTRVDFFEADMFKWMPKEADYDIIVSNPPYIDSSEKDDMAPNVLHYEPHEALFVPDDNPMAYYKRIADIGMAGLKPGGRLYLEINPRHADELVEYYKGKDYTDVAIQLDIHGKKRFLKCRRPSVEC